MELYDQLTAKAVEMNAEINKLRDAGEYNCSVSLQTGFIEPCDVLFETGHLDEHQLKTLKEVLQKR